MTVAVIFAGLLPIMLSGGTGAEVMQRIAAPMVGGMVTAPLLSLLVIPAAWMLMMRHGMARRRSPGTGDNADFTNGTPVRIAPEHV